MSATHVFVLEGQICARSSWNVLGQADLLSLHTLHNKSIMLHLKTILMSVQGLG